MWFQWPVSHKLAAVLTVQLPIDTAAALSHRTACAAARGSPEASGQQVAAESSFMSELGDTQTLQTTQGAAGGSPFVTKRLLVASGSAGSPTTQTNTHTL